MNSKLYALLENAEIHAKTQREKGTFFESLAKVYFEKDPLQQQFFSEVDTYAEWAKKHDLDGTDIGIDLVAKNKNDDGYCAIQCKFYRKDYVLQKKDLDSFIATSGKKYFKRRIIVDTTEKPFNGNLEKTLLDQQPTIHRIQLRDIERSPIHWPTYEKQNKIVYSISEKQLFSHQQNAVNAVIEGFKKENRGKLIMACGTGKTFTSLKIAEKLAGCGKRVLFLVPSLALMSQTVTEWSLDKKILCRFFAVCSDSKVGKRKNTNADSLELDIHDLAFPATTDAKKLAQQATKASNAEMTVIFATYQSIQVISDAQKQYNLPEFDLIICDEAHRTTGAKLSGEDHSDFTKVHYNDYIKGKKRLYMTATPRIYADHVKEKATEKDATLCSMDDPSLYGPVFFQRGFSWAVEQGLLSDYKVIVLAIDESIVSSSVQKRLSSEDNELQLDDAAKIIGCYKALTKADIHRDVIKQSPMNRAIAFCRDIKSSELIEQEFQLVVDEYLASRENNASENIPELVCNIRHVDGTFNAKNRTEQLDWLKGDDIEFNECRILSNARCLSEGVDIPALDAILFIHGRKSQIDVVQSVGRVMRKSTETDKRMGYVILPVVVPAGVEPENVLEKNERYKVIWQILNALRAHDDRLENRINQAALAESITDKIEIIAVTEALPTQPEPTKDSTDIGGEALQGTDNQLPKQGSLALRIDEVSKAVLAKIVRNCGSRYYWEHWAKDIAHIAENHITRIKASLDHPKTRIVFDQFLKELRDDLNDKITEAEAIEMLAQHLITKPVFDTLFENVTFTQKNPVSKAIDQVLNVLQKYNIDKESQSLDKFYDSVKKRASNLTNPESKQKLVLELYDKFFRNAFPRMSERLGIVYTPVEVVDFIIHSVNHVLKHEFNQTFSSKGVQIIDPFSGTGTFIARLLQSGLIPKENLAYKYQNEIHANEIVLLAYYIAAVNIEMVYQQCSGSEYTPFNGICLTDTFALYEEKNLADNMLFDNSERCEKQRALDIKVIMSNPPYSAGQKSANDNNANIRYTNSDNRLADTYVKHSQSTNKNALYDSYIRAIRWGSDQIKESGVMAYVSNGGWIDGSAMDGMRKCLAEEFSSLYIFHLRGDARTKGELRRKEKGNIFGEGTRTPIAITLFVKNPDCKTKGNIFYYDIGDYLSREEKLTTLSQLKSIETIGQRKNWQKITPNAYYDWLNPRDPRLETYLKIGDKKDKTGQSLFLNYSRGVMTCRDMWCYNPSQQAVADNMKQMIAFYNTEVERYAKEGKGQNVKDFINKDSTKISWDRPQTNSLPKGKKGKFIPANIILSSYRPFQKNWLYYDPFFNNCIYQIPKIFPNAKAKNRVIVVSGVGARSGFSALMVDHIPCLDMIEKNQCFPLKLYEKIANDNKTSSMFDELPQFKINDGISDDGLNHFKDFYKGEPVTKEAIFYYVYGLLHSHDYREAFKDNLTKELPRIPRVKTAKDFWAFSDAGRELAELHLNYECQTPHPLRYKNADLNLEELSDNQLRVEKWQFGKGANKKEKDKTVVVYNSLITMTDIPLRAYEYEVNGKPALEWIMDRQVVKTDKHSKIVSDANCYATETVGDAKYPLLLFQRMITVSLKTLEIVECLPKIVI